MAEVTRHGPRDGIGSYVHALIPRSVADAAPGLATLLRYPRANLRSDLVAGATVGIVAVPSSLAMAELAGLPVVYGLYGGLFVANIAMVILGLVILTPCLWLVNRPKPYLMAFVFALVLTGIYAMEQSFFDVSLVLAFGAVGYLFRLLGIPQLPLVLGVVLGFMVESNYRRALVLSDGDYMIFVQDRLSAVLLSLALVFVVGSFFRHAVDARRGA